MALQCSPDAADAEKLIKNNLCADVVLPGWRSGSEHHSGKLCCPSAM